MGSADQSAHISFLGTGDCGPVHGPQDGYPVEKYTELVRPLLQSVDLRVGNCERQYSRRGEPSELNPHGCQPPEMAQIYDDCGFDMLSLANNHMYDFGPDALLDTRALLLEKGIQVTGAGADLAEARQPAVVERNGVRVGLLSYCSVTPEGGEAGPNSPGIASLRTEVEYELRGAHFTPRVITRAHEQDLEMIKEDISNLRRDVHVILVSFHWGVLWAPRIISDYQVEVAHAAIDSGADMILGHHAHVPKAVEMYKGRAIFYSLSNFCMTKPFPSTHWAEAPWQHGALRNYTDQNPAMPLLPYGKDAKRTLLAKATFGVDGVLDVGFVPMMINEQYQPEPLEADDPRFGDMVDYMRWATEGFPTIMEPVGNTVMLAEDPST